MSQLAAELDELRHCGEVLIGISDTLREMFSGGDDMTVTQETPAEKPKGKEALPDDKALLHRKGQGGSRPLPVSSPGFFAGADGNGRRLFRRSARLGVRQQVRHIQRDGTEVAL